MMRIWMKRKREFSSTDCVSNEIELSLRMIESDNNSSFNRGGSGDGGERQREYH